MKRKQRRPKGAHWRSPEEAAELMAISEPTLRGWRAERRENQPAWYKFGNHVWYKNSDIDAWIEDQRRGPVSDSD